MSIQVGSLWLREGKKKDGSGSIKFYSGTTGYITIPPNANLTIFKNENKKGDKSPDYFLYVDEPYKKEASPAPASTGGNGDFDIPF